MDTRRLKIDYEAIAKDLSHASESVRHSAESNIESMRILISELLEAGGLSEGEARWIRGEAPHPKNTAILQNGPPQWLKDQERELTAFLPED